MEIEEKIYAILAAYTGLTNLVAARIYPGSKVQDCVLPALDFRRLNINDYPAMGSTASLNRSIFQFDVWAASQESAVLVKRQVEKCLDRYKSTGDFTIYDSFHKNSIDMGLEGESRQYHIAIDVEFHYDEQ